MQGRRRKMEDRYVIEDAINNDPSFSLFGVFDGHGGSEVPEFVRLHFTQVLCSTKGFNEQKYEEALNETFFELDELLRSEKGRIELLEIYKKDKPKTEPKTEEHLQLNIFKSIFDPRTVENCNIAMFSGCTVSVCLIINNQIYIANAGDSRVIAIKKDNIIYTTPIHLPFQKEEEERIVNANGILEDNRINGIINLSRCIGDLEYKKDIRLKRNQQIIIAEPKITSLSIENVDYVVLASDGLWNVKTDDVNMVNELQNVNTKDYGEFIENMFNVIFTKDEEQKAKDNITCIILKIKPEAKLQK